jgi:hypothetical protein
MTTDEPTDEQVRDLYAHFGLAYFHSEVLHRNLCIILAMVGLPAKHMITKPRVEERLEHAYSLTLGGVIAELSAYVPAGLMEELIVARDHRNYLAHRFWFEQIHMVRTLVGIEALMAMLDEQGTHYVGVSDKADAWFQAHRPDLELPSEALDQAMQRVLAGTDDPALGADTENGSAKSSHRGRRRLLRVWKVPRPGEAETLIFEFADGTFQQLSDAGFTRTLYDSPDETWSEQTLIGGYLPAVVPMRPVVEQPWVFAFKLRHGAVLWVRPGAPEGTFEWGLRTS